MTSNRPQMEESVTFALDPRGEEMFTHKDDDGTFRTFLTGKMFEFADQHFMKKGLACLDIIPAQMPIDKVPVEFIRKQMGVEQERIDRLIEPYLSRPCIGILWDGKDSNIFTLIDGNHRVLKLHSLGRKTFKVYLFKRRLWEQFIVEVDSPADRLTRPSGIIENERRKENGES